MSKLRIFGIVLLVIAAGLFVASFFAAPPPESGLADFTTAFRVLAGIAALVGGPSLFARYEGSGAPAGSTRGLGWLFVGVGIAHLIAALFGAHTLRRVEVEPWVIPAAGAFMLTIGLAILALRRGPAGGGSSPVG